MNTSGDIAVGANGFVAIRRKININRLPETRISIETDDRSGHKPIRHYSETNCVKRCERTASTRCMPDFDFRHRSQRQLNDIFIRNAAATAERAQFIIEAIIGYVV